jgi:phosphoribosylamine--glycine ligase
MGAVAPAPTLSDSLVETAMATIIRPTIAEMKARGTPFRGVLFAGLMVTAAGPKLIEYNVRFGDPECQVLMLRLEDDLADLLAAAVGGRLAGRAARWSDKTAVTVVMATRGYPGSYGKGSVIRGLDRAMAKPGVTIFHAGTAEAGDNIVASGGRVLNLSAVGSSVVEARRRAYAAVDAIDWPEGFSRRDIAAGAR